MVVPEIWESDLVAFQERHFSSKATDHFALHFLGPVEESYEEAEEEVEDDGLGYYEDGVKRTLTEEQIAIFRHSEIQALLRDRRHAEEARSDGDASPSALEEHGDGEVEDIITTSRAFEEGTMVMEAPKTATSANQPSKNKKKSGKKGKKVEKAEKARERGWFKESIKPDLRKRTWDKVDSGLGNLDYDEHSSVAAIPNPASQRRKISYEDN